MTAPARRHRAGMAPSMVFLATIPSAASGVRRVRISVPLIDCLVDGVRYFRPETLPPPEGQDLRALTRPTVGKMLGPDARPGRRSARCSARTPGRLHHRGAGRATPVMTIPR